MKHAPDTFEALLANWSTPELSADLGVPYVTARKMRERKSVGVDHWPRLVDAATRKGISIDVAKLVELRNQRSAA